jgi:hypothetical protein
MERPEQMSEGSNRAAKGLPEVRHGLPEALRRGNQGKGLFCAETAYFGRKRFEPFAYCPVALILSA